MMNAVLWFLTAGLLYLVFCIASIGNEKRTGRILWILFAPDVAVLIAGIIAKTHWAFTEMVHLNQQSTDVQTYSLTNLTVVFWLLLGFGMVLHLFAFRNIHSKNVFLPVVFALMICVGSMLPWTLILYAHQLT